MTSLGVVGLGNWGRNHARVALELLDEGRIDRLVLCDTDARRLEPYAKLAETASDPTVLVGSDLDAVSIVTPAETHFEIAKSFLEAGKHVLVEKPMTIRAAEAAALVSAAQERGLILLPGHIFRYHPGILKLEELLGQGALGTVRYLATSRTAFTEPRRDVGVLYSLAIHEADLYPHLLGHAYPAEAKAHVASFVTPGIDEIADVFFRFNGGAVGFAFASWISPGGKKERRLTVVGTRGSVEVDYGRPDAISFFDVEMVAPDGRRLFREGERRTIATESREPLRAEIEDFLYAVQSGGRVRPRADALSGHRAIEIIEALRTTGSFTAPRRP